MSLIIEFYYGRIRHTTSNLTIQEIWDKSDNFYLGTHNWITWLFPSKKRSCSHDAIVVREEELELFKKDSKLREKVLISLERVLRLYGFTLKLDNGELQVSKSIDFKDKSKNWLVRGNPNQNRIARILQSLMLIGFSTIAKKWLSILDEINKDNRIEIGDMMEYWNSSVNDPEEWNRGGRYGKAGGW